MLMAANYSVFFFWGRVKKDELYSFVQLGSIQLEVISPPEVGYYKQGLLIGFRPCAEATYCALLL